MPFCYSAIGALSVILLNIALQVFTTSDISQQQQLLTASPPLPWRQINRFAAEYRPDIAERMELLMSRNASASDPEVVQLARDVVDRPPENLQPFVTRSSSSWIKASHIVINRTPQATSVDKLLGRMNGGFFIECGAFDGESSSNTVWLEKERGWTGLLVEMDPYFYTQLMGKNRRVWSANVCLSPHRWLTKLPYLASHSQMGRLLYNDEVAQPPEAKTVNGDREVDKNRKSDDPQHAPCFPIESLLLAVNRSRIDYLSLDVEGVELEVLETVPWDQLDIRTLSVEYRHVPTGPQSIIDFMTSVGYSLVEKIHDYKPALSLCVHDLIFVSNRYLHQQLSLHQSE